MLYTSMSTKGQVIIPKVLRDHLNWGAGMRFEIEPQAGDVTAIRLKPLATPKGKLSPKELLKRMHATVAPYRGPPLSDAQVSVAMSQEAKRRTS